MTASLRERYAGVFDGRVGFGARPALIVVDFVRAYTEPSSPLYAPDVVDAVRASVSLVALARAREVPVVYTRVQYAAHGMDGGVFVRKVPALRALVAGAPLADIVDDLAPAPADTVLVKQYASAFFGTSLASLLTARGVDTAIVIGCSTSGCVRATAVDAMQHGFRTIVPRECVGDRAREPHEANLFDIDSKYGDVVSVAEVMEKLR